MQDDDLFTVRAALARLAHVQAHSSIAAADKRILDAVNRLLEVRCRPGQMHADHGSTRPDDVLIRARATL